MDGPIHLDFAFEEIVTLCELLGLAVPVRLGSGLISEVPDDIKALLTEAATRSLTARRVVDVDDSGAVTVLPAVADLFGVVSRPGLIGEVVDLGRPARSQQLVADPEIAVWHRLRANHVHRFSPFATRDLVDELVAALQVPDAAADGAQQKVPLGTWLHCEQRRHDPGTVRAALEPTLGAAVDGFVEAYCGTETRRTLTVVHRADADVVAGGTLTLVGDGTVYRCPPPISDEHGSTLTDPVEIGPAARPDVAEELISYLP